MNPNNTYVSYYSPPRSVHIVLLFSHLSVKYMYGNDNTSKIQTKHNYREKSFFFSNLTCFYSIYKIVHFKSIILFICYPARINNKMILRLKNIKPSFKVKLMYYLLFRVICKNCYCKKKNQ